MPSNKHLAFTLGILVCGLLCGYAVAQKETLLLSFNGTDGQGPYAGLVMDAVGNLYGTAGGGGSYSSGTVFELSPSNGAWTEQVLYSFTGGVDGNIPRAGVTLDALGNPYGTTLTGGVYGQGTVFELTPSSSGWTEQVLHSFGNGTDGGGPIGGVIFDALGNLYGTTAGGGTENEGTVFELSPSNGNWTETILYNFQNNTTDGNQPWAGVIFDKEGNLYGTTYLGGTNRVGTVWELMSSNGVWTYQILHSFTEFEGNSPDAGLIFDAAGNLYGTTSGAGLVQTNLGSVFELHKVGGSWTEKILHTFEPKNRGGGLGANGSLIFDASGNLYGTTTEGGAYYVGLVFELVRKSGWKEKILHTFNKRTRDGYYPADCLILDASGNLYGTTELGGSFNLGTVFEITP